MTLNRRIQLIKLAVVLLLIGPGLAMAAGTLFPAALAPVSAFLDLAHQPLDAGQAVDSSGAQLLNAILGGVLVGFGVLIWRVAEGPYRQDPSNMRAVLLVPMLAWFVVDSLGSVMVGAWMNALLNTAILAVLAAPLLWPTTPVDA